MPTTVVLKSRGNLRSQKGMATINQLSKTLVSIPGVKEVESATQPTGKTIQEFQLAYQNQQAAVELGQIQKGLSALSSNLSRATGKGGISPVSQLESGSARVTSGIHSLATGASQ